ncbi:MAG TPA: hypothetical protein VE153_07705 [Myxococcus sp.]|nr:hypothetical protein [Myxococcus sp.]
MANGSSPLEIVLGLAVFALLLGPAVYRGLRKAKQQQQEWAAFASRRDWSFTATGPASSRFVVQGLHHGYPVSVRTEDRGGSVSELDESYDVTVLRVDLRGLIPPNLSLTHEARDEKGGGKALPPAFLLEGATPDMRELLDAPRVRRLLEELHQAYERFSIEERTLEVVHRGKPETRAELEAVLAPVLALVEALDPVGARPAGERHG